MSKISDDKYDLGGVLEEVKKKMKEIKEMKEIKVIKEIKVQPKEDSDDSYKSDSDNDDHEYSLDNGDHDNDYDNEHVDDHEDDEKEYEKDSKHPKKYNYLTVESIPTEGFKADNMSIINQIKPGVTVKMCEACGKYFGENILVNIADMLQCYHCFFFMNFGNENTIYGQIGPTVVEYILLCEEQHKSPCSHLSDMGGCYLCLYKTGCPIEGLELLDKNKGIIDNSDNDSHCSIDDVCDTIIMNKGETVYI
jgi:hypothetical protein